MPITASDKTAKQIADHRPIWYERLIDAMIFWRHAIEGKLDGGPPRPVNVDGFFQRIREGGDGLVSRIRSRFAKGDANKAGDGQRQNNWVYPWQYESKRNYMMRLEKAVDDNFSGQVSNTYTGHFMAALNSFDIKGSSPEFAEKMTKNVDGKMTDRKQFTGEMFHELIGMGMCVVAVDSPTEEEVADGATPLPNAYIIPRENLIDIGFDRLGTITFARWKHRSKQTKDDVFSEEVEQIVGFTREQMFIVEHVKDRWQFKDGYPKPNPIGRVPLAILKMGKHKQSIVHMAAKLTVLIMNMRSSRETILTKQGIGIFYMPDGAETGFTQDEDGTLVFSAESVVVVKENHQPPGFATLDPNTTEGHRQFEQDMARNAYDSANLRKSNETFQKSADSKRWDWKDTEAVLKIGKSEIISAWSTIIEIAALWADTSATVEQSMNQFSIRELEEELAIIEKAILIDIGKIGNADARKKAYDLLNPDVDEKKRAEVHEQIDADEDKKEVERENMLNSFNVVEGTDGQ